MPKSTWQKVFFIGFVVVASASAVTGLRAGQFNEDATMIERGRYIAQLGGCNDCHTSGYLMNNGEIPESEWLKGDNFGWRGPWGTTYPPNLRLFLKHMDEDQWVSVARTLKRRPPMPWYTLNRMSEQDLRAFYRFVVSLGDPGEPAPAYVPPDREPETAYALFPSPPDSN